MTRPGGTTAASGTGTSPRRGALAARTGLGLYIVRNLAQANGGDVHHEPNPGGGARFVLDLEAAQA
ncbi:ATP-binding protein [Dactylosporangium sp. NPDC049140]|uniref:ATP-binding protein n=1 Tax=Dactylosporangium sp. NPDC049140 TaxID=3155647 RepID=UPI0033C04067